MKIAIQSLHFTARQELTDLINEKTGKLAHSYDWITEANVYLRLERSDVAENKVCEIRLTVPGNDPFAKRKAASFEEALVLTIEALQKQLEKLKTKFEDH
jgi:putative sigma-54 modulation protein